MLSAIGLNHQAEFDAGEVGDKRSNRMLPPELVACETTVAEQSPEQCLRGGWMPP
jgi:hypothetical protein